MSSQQVRTVFQNDQGKKTIDVYWIADDGGLTLLVPYLLTRRKNWGQSQVRVFIIGDEQNVEEGREEMISLLKRFRLDFHDVVVMTDSERTPQPKKSLPVPQTDCPMALYMAWLDVLTSGLHCPVVLIRGNQQNVLTFYCQ
ncbi:hypothetical protein CRUP_016063 [Coryphaenoides rupestris]|nr:hypothetical protein CRUP_016063 [Coryphaenoides rupestris]